MFVSLDFQWNEREERVAIASIVSFSTETGAKSTVYLEYGTSKVEGWLVWKCSLERANARHIVPGQARIGLPWRKSSRKVIFTRREVEYTAMQFGMPCIPCTVSHILRLKRPCFCAHNATTAGSSRRTPSDFEAAVDRCKEQLLVLSLRMTDIFCWKSTRVTSSTDSRWKIVLVDSPAYARSVASCASDSFEQPF